MKLLGLLFTWVFLFRLVPIEEESRINYRLSLPGVDFGGILIVLANHPFHERWGLMDYAV